LLFLAVGVLATVRTTCALLLASTESRATFLSLPALRIPSRRQAVSSLLLSSLLPELPAFAEEAPASTPKKAEFSGPVYDPSKEEMAAIGDAYSKLYKDPARPGAQAELESAEAIFSKEIQQWSAYSQADPEDWARLHLARAQARITLNEITRGQRLDKAQGAVEDYSTALKAMEVELADNPAKEVIAEYPDALVRRAMAFEELKNWEAAVKDYNTALSMSRKSSPGVNPLVLNFRGAALGRLGRYEEAVADFREATLMLTKVQEVRDAAMCQTNEALALYGAGRWEEALSTFEDVIKKDEAITDAHVALAAALWARGDVERAEAEWKFACEEIDVGCSDYEDIKWVSEVRRWPQSLVRDLKGFLRSRSV